MPAMQVVVLGLTPTICELQVDDAGAVVGLLTRESIAEAMAEAVNGPDTSLEESTNGTAHARKQDLFASQDW